MSPTAPPAPDYTRAARPRAGNTRPRLTTCLAHRVRPECPHRPRSRPVFGVPPRQLASDPSVPVEGGCANDYAYVHGDPINTSDLGGQAACNGYRASAGRYGDYTVVRRGLGIALDNSIYVRYEVYYRIKPFYRDPAFINRSGLVIWGRQFAQRDRHGSVTGHSHGRHIKLKPGSGGSPDPYQPHDTVTVKQGSWIHFAGAAADGPQLVDGDIFTHQSCQAT